MIRISPTARSIPFDTLNSSFTSNNLQNAIEEIDVNLTVIKEDIVNNSINAYRDHVVVTSGVISNGVELSASSVADIVPNSVFAFVDRLGIFEDVDFQLTDGPNQKVVFNFLPSALFTNGNPTGFIEGGEQLRIHYLTKGI